VTTRELEGEIDPRYSSADAQPTSWSDLVRKVETAEVFWLTTVRRDGRPHVTPLIAVWLDGALHFCTGDQEQKAKNLERDQRCVLTTGDNALGEGMDVVVEGSAELIDDDARLSRLAAAYESKYGSDWHFDVRGGRFHHEGGDAIVFAVAPTTVYAFAKGEPFSHTRFRDAATSSRVAR
jgi:general stress protein 26